MIKKIIFDLDDTLIALDDKLLKLVQLEKYSIPEEEYKKILHVLFTYEQRYDKYSYDTMYEEINEVLDHKMTKETFLTMLDDCKNLVPKKQDKKLIDTLKYLSSKYELVVLTNFFTEIQKARLEKYGILKYFSEVIGGDIEKCKPHFRSYAIACGFSKFEECLMVGDNLEFDVEMPLSFGMNAIWYTKNNKIVKDKRYKIVSSLYELKKLL